MTAPHGLTEAEWGQVQTVLALLGSTLGEATLAVVLHGSAVRGGLRPDSDLDLLVVTTRRLAAEERRVVVNGLLDASRSRRRPERPRHLEVTIVVAEDVRPWRYPPRLELQYGDWWRTEFEAGDTAPWHSPDPDLAIVLTAARADGRSLVGPPAEELFDPVPRDDLRHALTALLPGLLADLADDTRNVLLTLARIASTLENGAIEPKEVAAEHAARWLQADPAAVVRRARDGYLGVVDDRWDEPEAPAGGAGGSRCPAGPNRGPRRDIALTRVRAWPKRRDDPGRGTMTASTIRRGGRRHARHPTVPVVRRSGQGGRRAVHLAVPEQPDRARGFRAASDFPGGHEGDLLTVDFELDGHPFTALNGGPDFRFNESVSFEIPCRDQAEVDRYWDALIADGGEPSACGWLKDRFGLSWQVYPIQLNEWLRDGDADAARRTMEAMLQMGKLDAAALQRAHDGV